MKDLMTISLEQLRFFGYHGLYAEEQKIGNEFEVELYVSYKPVSGTVTGIQDTVNYVALFGIVQEEMNQPRHLLETLAMEITEKIHGAFPGITAIRIGIKKMNPPIAGIRGTVGVKYEKTYGE